MENLPKHKLYLGFRGVMIRIPAFLSEMGAIKGENTAKTNASMLSTEERRVHHFIVMKMAMVNEPFTAQSVASELGMVNDEVNHIIDKLESLKTFIYRSDGKRINWAYPFSFENTNFRMTASSGERFFAA